MAPSSALPIGATRTVSEMQPVKIDPASHASGLLNAVLALLAPPYHDDEAERYDEEVLDLHVVGFLAVYVHPPFPLPPFRFPCRWLMRRLSRAHRTSVDVPNRRMTVLSPSPGSFAGRTAVIGSFEWSEQ